MNCANCNGSVPQSARLCPVCQADVGFPNVRAAQTVEETTALGIRLQQAYVSTGARGCKDVLERFGDAVLKSKAVFCKNISIVHALISSKNILYISFCKQVASGCRLPNDDQWELARPGVESTLYPHYHEEINIACLTLNNEGLTNYGAYSILLKDQMISLRSSVFEENSCIFMEKYHVIAGQPIPCGHRASWGARGEFAMAKLHSKIDSQTKDADFPGILMNSGQTREFDEFIEVHIYGPIHPNAIERIVGPRPTKKDDLVLWKSLQTMCKANGIIVEVS